MGSYDFYSPFVSATIITRKGDRVPLRTNVFDGKVTSAGNKIKDIKEMLGLVSLPFLENLRVDLDLSMLPTITATLTPPFNDARNFIDSILMEFGQSELEVIFGYSSGTPDGPVLSTPLTALIMPPSVQLGHDVIITIRAIGTAGHSMATQKRAINLTKKSRLKLIKELAEGTDPDHKRDVEVDDSEVTEGRSRTLLDADSEFSPGGKSDWNSIAEIARDCGCWSVLENNKLKLIARSVSLALTPKYRLRLFDFDSGIVGPSNGDFPILSLSSPSAAVWLPGSTAALVSNRGIRSSDQSPTFKKYEPEEKGIGGGQAGPTADKDNPVPDPKSGEGGGMFLGDANSKALDNMASSKYAEDQFKTGIKMEVETIGIPKIFPGDVVSVRGVSKRFDWNYGVFHVSHTIGHGGYLTRLTLISNTAAVLANALKSQMTVERVEAEGKPPVITSRPHYVGK